MNDLVFNVTVHLMAVSSAVAVLVVLNELFRGGKK